MHYIQKGEGANLVFLHGWGADSTCFLPLINHFAADFCVTAFDFHGHGKTPPPIAPFTIFDFCDIINDTLTKMGITNATFICHSFGARVGILLAALHPERVKKLIFTGAAGVRPRRGIKYHIKVATYKFKKRLVKRGIISPKRLEKSGSTDFRALSGVMKKTFINVVNTDLTPYLSKIACPTLLIWGEDDHETPLYMAKKMVKKIPDCGLVVLPAASHFAFLDKPKHFKIIAQNFLKENTKC